MIFEIGFFTNLIIYFFTNHLILAIDMFLPTKYMQFVANFAWLSSKVELFIVKLINK